MSDLVVRPTEPGDLPRISELTETVFGIRRDVGLLEWLLGRSRRVESWLAESNGKVCGHLAILRCRYAVGGRRLTGAHPYLWMVEAGHRGRAGMRLARLILRSSDFQLVLGGTPMTRAILSKSGFVSGVEAWEYAIAHPPREEEDLVVLPVSRAGTDARNGPAPLPPRVVANEAADDHLEWLASCPELEAHRFVLARRRAADRRAEGARSPEEEVLGPLLLYVHRRREPAAGRLVHLPFLGDEPGLWRAALGRVGHEFERLGCDSFTLLATHPALLEACRSAGARVVASRPVWIREEPATLVSTGRSWHLTYLEGDLAYRRVDAARSHA